MKRNPILYPLALGVTAVTLAGWLAPCPAQGQTNYAWTNLTSGNASGSWGTAAAWNPAGPAGGVDNTAQFTLPLTNATTPGTITLDGNRTIGNLTFGNTSASNLAWTVNAGTPTTSALTLSLSSGTPVINVTNQGVTIGAPISSAQGFLKTGGGSVSLANANNFGAGSNAIVGGRLLLNNLGALPVGTIVGVSSGSALRADLAGTYNNIAATISGSGFTGDNNQSALLFRSGGATTVSWPGAITLNGNSTIGSYGVTYNTTLGGVISGTGNLTIAGQGGSTASHTAVFNLNNQSAYLGNTTFANNGGLLSAKGLFGTNNALPTTTALTVNNGNANTYSILDFNGYNQTLASLSIGGSAAANALLTNSSATLPTITLNTSSGPAFTLNAGTNFINNLTLTCGGSGDTASMIGVNGNTVLNVSNVTWNSSFYTDLGRSAATVVNLNNGTTLKNTGELLMGYGNSAGVGTLNINTGAVVNAHYLRIGNNAVATNNLNAGGRLVVDQVFDDYGITNNSSTFNFNGGLLQVGTGGEAWFQSSIDNALIQNGGAIIDTAGKYATINAPLRPGAGSTGGLVKLGAGTLRLADSWTYTGTTIDSNTVPPTTNTFPVTVLITNTYLGATIISNGLLVVDGALPSSAVQVTTPGVGATNALLGAGTVATATVNPGGSVNPGRIGMAGTLSVSNLTTSAGAYLVSDITDPTQIGNGANDLLAVNTLTAANPTYISFNPLYGSATPGTYVVATYNTLSGLPSYFALDPSLAGSRYGAAVDATSTPGQISVVITNGQPPNPNLIWYGNNPNNNWDVATTANWSSGADDFFNLDSTSFYDAAATNVVNLVGTLYPTTVNFYNYSDPYTLTGSGKLSGPAALVLNGTAKVLIATDNDNAGATTLNGSGTLQIGDGSTHGALGSGDVQFVGSGNTLAYDRLDALTLSNRIYGSSSATPDLQVNSGTLTLAGTADNAYAVATVTNNATLVMAKTSSSSVHALGGGGTALTISAGSTAKLGGSGGDQIVNARDVQNDGTFDLAGQSETINNLMGAGVVTSSSAGSAALGLGASGATVTFNGVVQNGAGTVGLTAVGGTVILTTTNTATGPLTLVGGGVYLSNATAQAWAGPVTFTNNTGVNPRLILQASEQIGDTSVMSFGGNGAERRFQLNGFNETLGGFNDLAGVAGNRIVEAATDNQDNSPATLTLNVPAGITNTMNGYVRDASGTTNSHLTLSKTGPGTQVFSGSAAIINYSGPTTVANGVLQLSGGSVLANSAVTLTGGTLNISGGGTRATPIAGNGTFQVGGGTFITTATNTYTGTTIISAGGTLQLGSAGTSGMIQTAVTNSGTLTVNHSDDITLTNVISGAGTVNKLGSDTVVLLADNSLWTGPLTLPNAASTAAGWLQVGANTALGASGTAKTINLTSSTGTAAGGIQLAGGVSVDANKTITIGGRSADAVDRSFLQNLSGNNTWAGPLQIAGAGGTYYISSLAGRLELSGTLYNNVASSTRAFNLIGAGDFLLDGLAKDGSSTALTALNLAGAGTVTVAGTHTYSGTTTVSGGKLLVSATGVIPTNSVTVATNAALGGNGTILGAVTVQGGGTLSPGTSIGTLTISNSLTLNALSTNVFEVNATLGTNDQVRGLSTVTYGGTLVVTNLPGGPITMPISFKLFEAATYNAAQFASVQLPALLGSNLAWTNLLTQNGTIAVVSAVPPASPQATGVGLLPDHNFSLTVTGAVGSAWSLHATNNVTAPQPWPVIQTGTVTTSPFTVNDLTATNYAERFYRFSAP